MQSKNCLRTGKLANTMQREMSELFIDLYISYAALMLVPPPFKSPSNQGDSN